MQRFWSWLAVNLGKRAGLVSIIGLLVTLALGAGITQLHFTSSQDAYLNKSDQVYKDNVAYQNLFGGEAMLTVITMDKGHNVVELLDDANRAEAQPRSASKLAGRTSGTSSGSSHRSTRCGCPTTSSTPSRAISRRASPAS